MEVAKPLLPLVLGRHEESMASDWRAGGNGGGWEDLVASVRQSIGSGTGG